MSRYAEKLERYRSAFGTLTNNAQLVPSPSNRVKVYVVSGSYKVKKLYGDKASRYLMGFYRSRAGGSIAIVPRIKGSFSGNVSQSEQTLLHEYAHHFMRSNNRRIIPRWFSEGFAEFYSTASFERDGGIGLGLPANQRAYELTQSHNIPLEEIFDTRLYLQNKKKNRYDNFYGRSWLLYHYLFFSVDRRGQLSNYLDRLQQGEPELAAAKASFGSLEILNKELLKYLRKGRFHYLPIPAESLKIGPVTVSKLSAAEAAMMPIIIRSRSGVTRQEANEILPQARDIASKFPRNPVVMGALAEAEVDSGNYTEAIAAADSALEIDPSNIDAHIQKGYAMTHLAKAVEGVEAKAAAWRAVRLQFVTANRLEVENPLPLVHFYRSYQHQGIEPTKNAVVGLESALELAPFDKSVRAMVAAQQLNDGRFVDARKTLIPLAYGPHQKENNPYLAMLKLAEKKIDDQPKSD